MSDSESLQPYVFAPFPSPQVRIVREYLKYYGEFDLQNLSNLITDNFTQQTWPQSLNAAVRTKEQEFEALKGLKDSLKGQPLDVSSARTQCDHPFVLKADFLDRSRCTISATEIRRPGFM